jgi:hypothetical protein
MLTGCQSVSGPRANRDKPRPDDPIFSIDEQQRRGRDRYPIVEDNPGLVPPGGIGRYGSTNPSY